MPILGLKFLLLATLAVIPDWVSSDNLVKTSRTTFVNHFLEKYTSRTVNITAVTDGDRQTCHEENIAKFDVSQKYVILRITFKPCARVAMITVQGDLFPSSTSRADVAVNLCNGATFIHQCSISSSSLSCTICRDTFTCTNGELFRYVEVRMFSRPTSPTVLKLCEISVLSFLKTVATTSPPATVTPTTAQPTSKPKATQTTIVPTKNSCPARSTWQYIPSPSSKNCSSLTSCSTKTIRRSLECTSTSSELLENRCCKSIPTPAPKHDKCSLSCRMSWSEWGPCSGTCACGTRVQTGQCLQKEKKSGRVKPVNVKKCQSVGLVDAAVSERKENCSLREPCYESDRFWSNCSAECGNKGVQKEMIVCHAIETCSRQQKRVPISKCDKRRLQSNIGVREKVCESKCNLTTSSWSDCSVAQGQGVKTRTVSCYRNGQLVHVNACYNSSNLTVPINVSDCEDQKSSLGISIGVSTAVFILLLVLLIFAIVILRRKNWKHSKVSVTVEMSTVQESAVSVLEESATLPLTPTNSVHVTEIDNEQCTAYAKITAVKLGAFPQRSAKLLKDGSFELHEEFQSLDSIGKSKSTSFGKDRDNIHKNRYKNTVPYDDNRIILDEVEGLSIPETDYINASYIDGFRKLKEFIACQGPLTGTCSDMWRMVWSESASTIVMLCGFMENGRVKCERYWSDDQMENYDGLTVKVIEIQRLANYTVRKMRLHLEKDDDDDDVRYVTHYHFKSWLDHDTPKHPNSLLGMIRHLQRERKPGRMIVHCSAGVGRTGTFLAILTMMSRVDAGESVDIRGYVGVMRTKRMQMVQTLDQYRFIYMAVRDYVMGRSTELRLEAFKKETKDFRYGNSTFLNTVKEQYDLLEAVGSKCDKSLYLAALSLPVEVAKTKNRSLDILPPDSSRVYLRRGAVEPAYANVGNGSYINASYIDSYYKRDGFIVTQYPMEGTIADFWRMIFQKSTVAIVNLTQPNEEEPYWPTTGHSTYGAYTVQFESFSDMQGHSVTELKIKKESSSLIVNLYHCRSWPEDGHPEESPALFRLMKEVEIWQQYHDSAPIVVHCSTGVGRSGAFCATWNVIDQIENEKVVNIFDAAKFVRNQRPGIISSLTYYESIWFNVVNYVSSRDIYANI